MKRAGTSQQRAVESIDLLRGEQSTNFTLEVLLNGVERRLSRAGCAAILIGPRNLKISVVDHRAHLKDLVIIKSQSFLDSRDGEFRILDWSLFRRFLRLWRPRRPWCSRLLCQNSR